MASTEVVDAKTKAARQRMDRLEREKRAATELHAEAVQAGVTEDEMAAIKADMARLWPLGI